MIILQQNQTNIILPEVTTYQKPEMKLKPNNLQGSCSKRVVLDNILVLLCFYFYFSHSRCQAYVYRVESVIPRKEMQIARSPST